MAVTTSNWQAYLSQNPDLTAAGIKDEAGALAHYNTYGKNEGRQFGVMSGAQMAPAQNLGMTPEAGGSATFNESMPQTGGMNIGGKYYSPEQIKQFYANGGNDNMFAQNLGLTDQNQIHDLAVQARAIGGAPTGEQAMKYAFNQYQQYNPNGAYANNYQGFVGDQNPATANAIRSGTYTGAYTSPTDYAPGGIYEGVNANYKTYGLGARGLGDGWDAGKFAGSGGGSANLGMGGVPAGNAQYQAYQSGNYNPYLKEMGNTIVNQMTDNYNRNQLPAMRSGAVAAGGFGGSRQGVVEANGLNDLNRGIGQNLTNLYGQDWTNAQNRNLQQQSINNSYDLGLKSNDLGYANLDSNNQQFGANYGLNVLNAQNQWAQNGVQATTNMQNTPGSYNTMFNNNQNAIAGQGGTSTNTQNNQGNPWLGALGGAQMANTWLK